MSKRGRDDSDADDIAQDTSTGSDGDDDCASDSDDVSHDKIGSTTKAHLKKSADAAIDFSDVSKGTCNAVIDGTFVTQKRRVVTIAAIDESKAAAKFTELESREITRLVTIHERGDIVSASRLWLRRCIPLRLRSKVSGDDAMCATLVPVPLDAAICAATIGGFGTDGKNGIWGDTPETKCRRQIPVSYVADDVSISCAECLRAIMACNGGGYGLRFPETYSVTRWMVRGDCGFGAYNNAIVDVAADTSKDGDSETDTLANIPDETHRSEFVRPREPWLVYSQKDGCHVELIGAIDASFDRKFPAVISNDAVMRKLASSVETEADSTLCNQRKCCTGAVPPEASPSTAIALHVLNVYEMARFLRYATCALVHGTMHVARCPICGESGGLLDISSISPICREKSDNGSRDVASAVVDAPVAAHASITSKKQCRCVAIDTVGAVKCLPATSIHLQCREALWHTIDSAARLGSRRLRLVVAGSAEHLWHEKSKDFDDLDTQLNGGESLISIASGIALGRMALDKIIGVSVAEEAWLILHVLRQRKIVGRDTPSSGHNARDPSMLSHAELAFTYEKLVSTEEMRLECSGFKHDARSREKWLIYSALDRLSDTFTDGPFSGCSAAPSVIHDNGTISRGSSSSGCSENASPGLCSARNGGLIRLRFVCLDDQQQQQQPCSTNGDATGTAVNLIKEDKGDDSEIGRDDEKSASGNPPKRAKPSTPPGADDGYSAIPISSAPTEQKQHQMQLKDCLAGKHTETKHTTMAAEIPTLSHNKHRGSYAVVVLGEIKAVTRAAEAIEERNIALGRVVINTRTIDAAAVAILDDFDEDVASVANLFGIPAPEKKDLLYIGTPVNIVIKSCFVKGAAWDVDATVPVELPDGSDLSDIALAIIDTMLIRSGAERIPNISVGFYEACKDKRAFPGIIVSATITSKRRSVQELFSHCHIGKIIMDMSDLDMAGCGDSDDELDPSSTHTFAGDYRINKALARTVFTNVKPPFSPRELAVLSAFWDVRDEVPDRTTAENIVPIPNGTVISIPRDLLDLDHGKWLRARGFDIPEDIAEGTLSIDQHTIVLWKPADSVGCQFALYPVDPKNHGMLRRTKYGLDESNVEACISSSVDSSKRPVDFVNYQTLCDLESTVRLYEIKELAVQPHMGYIKVSGSGTYDFRPAIKSADPRAFWDSSEPTKKGWTIRGYTEDHIKEFANRLRECCDNFTATCVTTMYAMITIHSR